MLIEKNCYIYIFKSPDQRWLVKVNPERKFFTNDGPIDLASLVGKPFGTQLNLSGHAYFLLKPLPRDFALLSQRRTNIIHPKDAGLLIVNAGIGPGSKVLESGVGSGALSILLANAVKPDGHIHSYEIREEFVNLATNNIKRAGVDAYITIHHQDVTEGVVETEFTAVVLDLGEPWAVLPVITKVLIGGGVLTSYSPTIEQVMKTVKVLESQPYVDIRTIECLVRDILVREGKTRPNSQMIGHTGYLTFARRILELPSE